MLRTGGKWVEASELPRLVVWVAAVLVGSRLQGNSKRPRLEATLTPVYAPTFGHPCIVFRRLTDPCKQRTDWGDCLAFVGGSIGFPKRMSGRPQVVNFLTLKLRKWNKIWNWLFFFEWPYNKNCPTKFDHLGIHHSLQKTMFYPMKSKHATLLISKNWKYVNSAFKCFLSARSA